MTVPRITTALLALALAAPGGAHATSPGAASSPAAAPTLAGTDTLELRWNDLQSPRRQALEKEANALQRRLAALGAEERKRYEDVALELAARDSLAAGKKFEDLLPELRAVLEAQPSRSLPEAVELWQRVGELRDAYAEPDEAPRLGLDGRRIRLPGYALPLRFDGTRVTEFLLVPFVGACIHVPPPPANQMVHVVASEPFESEGVFAPVWVEGVIQVEAGEYDLDLVDGNSAVAAGYRVSAGAVEPYTPE